jgi:tyrosine-protein kinase Etk/Wzc
VGGPVAQQALEWRVDLDEVRRERMALERALRAAPDQGMQIGALSALTSVQASPPLQLALDELTQQYAEMRALRNRYREASAPVQDLQESIDRLSGQTIPALVQQLVAQLREREADIAPRVDSAFGNLRRVPALSLQQARLAREVAAAERLYTDVRDRYENAQLELASSVSDVQVLDPAVEPQRPLEGFAPLVIALSFLTSLVIAIVAATIWDQRDPKVRYPNQVTRGMRMDIVGALPHVNLRKARRGTAGEMEVVESVRALRHRVQQARSPDGALALTITSPGVGDGKSFVSLNLALSFAYAGYRTLLIDGDVRRGGQHRALDVPLQPGLTDVLTDRAPIELAVRGTPYANLSIMPAGTRMHRAPELLESQELRDMLARLRLTYAVIIVDSPPLQAGIDPLVLTTATVNGILVMRAGATEIPSTLSKLDYLDSLPVRMLGVVLNDVRDGSAFREYRYDLRGYELPDEDRPQLLGGRR